MVLSEFQRGQIIGMNKLGVSVCQIAKQLKIPKSTIQDIIALFNEKGSCTPQKSSGRPSLIKNQEGEKMIEEIKQNPFKTAADLWRDEKLNVNQACLTTIKNYLAKHRIVARRMPKITCITETNKQKRATWCMEKQDWLEKDFNKIYFSDESMICFSKSGIKWIRKEIDSGYSDQMFEEIQQFNGGLRLMIWGMISSEGPVSFAKVEGSLNSKNYIKQILKKHVAQQNEIRTGEKIYQQDNARARTAQETKNWLESNGIMALSWPPQSPDLNPIEQVWAFVKDGLWNFRFEIKDTPQLYKKAKALFNSRECCELIKKLYLSLPSRIKLVIQAKGETINKIKLQKKN